MKKIMFNLLLAIFLWLGSCAVVKAQATGDQITQDNQVIQDDSTSTGTFSAVTVDPLSTSDVALQFPLSYAGKLVGIEALDGGTVTAANAPTIANDGSLSFSFQVNDQPGVHRVIVIDPNADEDSPHIVALVQFEVPNPPE